MRKIIIVCICMLVVYSTAAQVKNLDSILCNVFDKDQIFRKKISEAQRDGEPTEVITQLYADMFTSDRENQDIVFEMLNTGGWPENISAKSNMAIFLVINHSDMTYQQYYLPLVKKQAEAGKIAKHYVAALNDRILMNLGKPQIYGTQTINYVDQSGESKFYLWPLAFPADIAALRSSMNMPPLETFLESFRKQGIEIVWDQQLDIEKLSKSITDDDFKQ